MQSSSERFNGIAANYAASEIHRDSPTIRRLHELLAGETARSVCDVACGAGYLGLSFAGKAERIVALDPAPSMLEAARKLSVALTPLRAFAERIPLADGTFDLVATRVAAHHFADIERAVQEMARITRPGGLVAVIDLEGYDDPEVDDLNHRLEMLHDPTHVRSYSTARWRRLLEGAGLRVEVLEDNLSERPAGVTVERWCQIASSGLDALREIVRIMHESGTKVLETMQIRAGNGTFRMTIRTLLAVARKPV